MTTGRPLPYVAVVVCLVLGAALPAAQGPDAQAPAIPQQALDKLPPVVRAGLQSAYDSARALPGDASAVGRLGMLLHAYEQYRPAEVCYRIARELAPRSMSWTYLSAVVQAELGADAVAATSFRESLRIDPAYLPARLRLADTLMRAGSLDASRTEYEALVREFPELALAHYGLGRVSSTLGDAAGAAAHYQRAVDMEPEFGPAHYALALAYRSAGAGDRAGRIWTPIVSSATGVPWPADRLIDQIRSMKGTARDLLAEGARLGRAGRLRESIAVHLKAIDADPADAQAHVNLISLYGRTGQPDGAEKHYRAALGLGSSLAEAHYTTAYCSHHAADTRRRPAHSGRRSASTHFTRRRTITWRLCSLAREDWRKPRPTTARPSPTIRNTAGLASISAGCLWRWISRSRRSSSSGRSSFPRMPTRRATCTHSRTRTWPRATSRTPASLARWRCARPGVGANRGWPPALKCRCAE